MALRRRPRPRRSIDRAGLPAAENRRRHDARQRQVAAALADGSIQVEAQPIVDLVTGAIVGADAVFGHRRPVGDTSVEVLLARPLLAEAGGDAVIELNALLVEGVGAMSVGAAGTSRSGIADGLVSVTVDDRFVASDEFLTTVKESVRRADLEPSQLVLSIDAKPGFEPLWTNLQRLKSHGVQVALDGFVLGDAPTEILRRYPFDLVRFAAPSTGEGGELLESTVRLAHNLGCAAIADRVETAAQAAGLRCSGTDLAVGPFFVPAG